MKTTSTPILRASGAATILASFALASGLKPGSEAAALVASIENTVKNLRGFHCKLLSERTFTSKNNKPAAHQSESVEITFERPNLFFGSSKTSNEGKYDFVSDGKNVYSCSSTNYGKNPIDRNAESYHWFHDDLALLLVTGSFDKAFELPVKPTTTLVGNEDWNGKTYQVLDMSLGGGYPIDYKVYVGSDHIVRRIVHTEMNEGHPWVEDFTMTEFEENPSVDKSAFKFTPTSEQKPYDNSYASKETPLITVGREAAPFALPTPEGPRLSLTEALAGRKALLLNFWFVHCPPCRAEHPKLERLYEELKDQGFGILSVDDQDTADSVAKYWKGAGLTFRTVLSGPRAAVDSKTGYIDYRGPKLPDYASLDPYGVHACPTNVLLNSQGEVVYVSTGWDEAGLRAALQSLGIK